MVRYSGFLANRKRGSLLPLVYEALQMQTRKKPEKPGMEKKRWLRMPEPDQC
ncbi:putative iSPsy3 transposase, partial [Candidatus Erwinia dacicola]